MKLRFAVCCLAAGVVSALAGPQVARGQEGRGAWQTVASGDEVISLASDPIDARLIWAGTESGGLVRWNVVARTFDQFLFPQQAGLNSNRIRDIAFDPAGQPWLATAAGVTVAGAGAWRTYDMADGLPADEITAIAVGSSGTAWAGTSFDGVAELPSGATSWTVHEFDISALGPGAMQVADIAIGADDRVWVAHGRATSGGQPALSVYDPASGVWDHIAASTPGGGAAAGPPSDQILALDFGADGVLWAGSWAQSVLWFDGAQWGQYGRADGVCGRNVIAVSAAGDEVWASCGEDSGVARFDGATWQSLTTSDGLPTDTVAAVVATGGAAYLGTNGPGIRGSGVVPVTGVVEQAMTTSPQTPFVNDMTALAFDAAGRPWVGTRGFGLLVRSDGEWRRYTRENTGGGLAGDMITGLAWKNGVLWVSTTRAEYQAGAGYLDGGFSSFDPATDAWTTVTTANSNLPAADVSSIAVADDGRVWVGLGTAIGEPGENAGNVHNGRGVAAYDPTSGQFVTFFDYESTAAGLTGNTVLDVATSGGDVWAATTYHNDAAQRRRGGGVGQYGAGAWTPWIGGVAGFRSYHGSGVETDPDPFITGDVRSVAVDQTGAAWAGTWDLVSGSLAGLWPFVDAVVNRYDGTGWISWEFEGSGWVSSIAEAADGSVWIGTTRGHDLREFSIVGGSSSDTAVGGVRVFDGSDWVELTPLTSGLASTAITAIASNPVTGDMWVATENEGLSVFYVGDVPPTPTTGPSSTPGPTSTATVPALGTVAPSATPRTVPTSISAPPAGSTPEPPREVPEPATVVLMGAGLAGLAAWRRRQAARQGR